MHKTSWIFVLRQLNRYIHIKLLIEGIEDVPQPSALWIEEYCRGIQKTDVNLNKLEFDSSSSSPSLSNCLRSYTIPHYPLTDRVHWNSTFLPHDLKNIQAINWFDLFTHWEVGESNGQCHDLLSRTHCYRIALGRRSSLIGLYGNGTDWANSFWWIHWVDSIRNPPPRSFFPLTIGRTALKIGILEQDIQPLLINALYHQYKSIKTSF